MTLYEVKIETITSEKMIADLKTADGVDKVFVCRGTDKDGQIWQWLYIRRTMKDAGTFHLPRYGMVRLTKAEHVGGKPQGRQKVAAPKEPPPTSPKVSEHWQYRLDE